MENAFMALGTFEKKRNNDTSDNQHEKDFDSGVDHGIKNHK